MTDNRLSLLRDALATGCTAKLISHTMPLRKRHSLGVVCLAHDVITIDGRGFSFGKARRYLNDISAVKR
jgi:hypothetical protein